MRVSQNFSLKGNKCGSAKEYCVVADGWQLNVGGYINSGTSVYPTQKSGSSLAAPMISGGIALLSQAFPNHTPEQLTDRLLASANNSWFTPEGNTTLQRMAMESSTAITQPGPRDTRFLRCTQANNQ